jgi:hypothetical protein
MISGSEINSVSIPKDLDSQASSLLLVQRKGLISLRSKWRNNAISMHSLPRIQSPPECRNKTRTGIHQIRRSNMTGECRSAPTYPDPDATGP